MILFKDLTLEDRQTITNYTMNSNRRNCDLSFSNLCSWRFLYDTQFAEVDGFLVLKFKAGERPAHMMPVGNGDLRRVILKLEENAREAREEFRMLGITPDMKAEIEAALPERFAFTANRDYADYIYLRTDLANLTGKKYQSKRNHINKLKKACRYEYRPLTAEYIPECLRLEAEWCHTNHCEEQEGMLNECRAIVYALTHFDSLGLTGGLLLVDGKVMAFTFGMPINGDTFGVHVEKAHASIDGAYAAINCEFAARIPEQYTYINREEDLGIEGLRQAKLSYRPVILLEKSEAFAL
ncbi:MAG: phosphatidylglycerol lysyltransferase domain-containing protein [Mediterranea sp.]|jgi:hypothetical protein|nr:phosphatidylglycerol lysyltransferase domain-containing protein [Mediterranea sp.]